MSHLATATPAETRFFAVHEGGEWNVVDHLDPDLDNYGPFSTYADAATAIYGPDANTDDLPLYEPTRDERTSLVPTIVRLADALNARHAPHHRDTHAAP